MEWTTACPDWEERIVARRSIVPVKPLFPDMAEDALDVFGALRMVDATGSPLMRDACEPWVMDLVAALFGAYDPDRQRRLITSYFLMVSKKNGKSTIAAGVMLTALILNLRPSGEFIILAPTKEAADNAYKPIRDMINANPELEARFHEQGHLRTITDRLNQATLKVVAADSATVTGKKAIGVFIDELWEFGKQAKAADMLTEATGGLASRPEGFIFYCTTQSDAPPSGVFNDKLSYARKVRDGLVVDKRFLPVIYEFPQAMIAAGAHKDLSNAYITNPNWGVSVDEEVIAQKFQEASEAGEGQLRGFWAKHLNVEIGLNLRSDRWMGAEFWEQQADAKVTLDYLLSNSEVITAGIDGGGMDDMLGTAFIGREKYSGRLLLCNHAWIHPVALDRRKQEAARYHDFEADGDLTIIEALPDDVSQIAEMVKRVYDSGLLSGVGLDPEKTHKVMFQALIDIGIPEEIILGVSQGWKLIGSIVLAERKLAEKKMIHSGSRLMNWCVGNARVEPRGNASLITKQASGNAKIDPLMATFNAASLMALNPASSGNSFWDAA